MKIVIAKSSGFCMGVRRAIEMALDASSRNERPIFTLGPLIHNPQVLASLAENEIHPLEEIPVDGTGTVLIRAHGVAPEIKKDLRKAGFKVLDATCPRVLRIQAIIKKYARQNHAVIILGDKNHPEVRGLMGCAGKNAFVVGDMNELDDLPSFEKAIMVAQSTQNTNFFVLAQEWAEKKSSDYKIFETICDSTENRQEEVRKLARTVDILIVVGGKESANTSRLYEVAKKSGKPAFHIETEADLDSIDTTILCSASSIGITSGASTPSWIIKRVYNALEELPRKNRQGWRDVLLRLQKTMRKRSPGSTGRDIEMEILQGVSRSFAFTIPQLPPNLDRTVSNAYLLCRIIDTIEDETSLDLEQKEFFLRRFLDVVDKKISPDLFSSELHPLLGNKTVEAERELIVKAPVVIERYLSFSFHEQSLIKRCLKIMHDGMAKFQKIKSPSGLKNLLHLQCYCYHVAGVVGEMLTGLFCHHSQAIAKNGEKLYELASSFGQGLQMTNILKDLWEDKEAGVCWLPQDVFGTYGFDLEDLTHSVFKPAFGKGLAKMVGITHMHLRNAFDYAMLIPRHEYGIRKFCLFSIGMAVLTLQNINNNRDYRNSGDVKISRAQTKTLIALTNATLRSNLLSSLLFETVASGLPLENADKAGTRTIFSDGKRNFLPNMEMKHKKSR